MSANRQSPAKESKAKALGDRLKKSMGFGSRRTASLPAAAHGLPTASPPATSLWTNSKAVNRSGGISSSNHDFEPSGYSEGSDVVGETRQVQSRSSRSSIIIPSANIPVPPNSYNNGSSIAINTRSSPTTSPTPLVIYSPGSKPSSPFGALVVATFVTRLPDELSINPGEKLRVLAEYDDGWALCMNNTGEQGMVPVECLSRGSSVDPPSLPAENMPKAHQEADNFDGDRVLANSTLFFQDFGWWIEMLGAVPEGNIGWAFEILKIWIFMFAGSSHQNYMAYLLEVYCFLRYEASEDVRDGVLNNWLVNITGELGKWIEGALLQEHYNRWLEEQVQKQGGDFDDRFYRSTLSPSVSHFLRTKEEIENSFQLSGRAKTHTPPHLGDELRLLLALSKEEFLHLLCTGQTLGQAAVNQLDHGFGQLQIGKLHDFIRKSTVYADALAFKQTNKLESNAHHLKGDVQRAADLSTDINTVPPSGDIDCPSELSVLAPQSSGSLPSSSSTLSSHLSDDVELAEIAPSNNHLVSGSEYDVYVSEDGLTHRAWYEQADEEYSSSDPDEDDEGQDFDAGVSSDEEYSSSDPEKDDGRQYFDAGVSSDEEYSSSDPDKDDERQYFKF